MRVLIAPDSFGGTLTARQAAQAIAAGWRRGAPGDEVLLLPLADGGPGFLDVLRAALGGELVPATVTGPLGDPVPAAVLLTAGETPVAYIESAQAVGLHLVPIERRDPTRTSSVGVGQLLRVALDLGARRVVVGLGGSVTNDSGAGMLSGLGVGSPTLRAGGGALIAVTGTDLAGLSNVRAALAGVDLIAAADVDVPLLGLSGASAGFAGQKGASPAQAQDLERCLAHFAQVVGQVLADPSGPDRARLLASRSARDGGRGLTHLPGAGAAGGLGFALAALGARVLPGALVTADAVGLDRRAGQADLLVTGEGTLDWQSLRGKVVSAVAARGLSLGIPVVVVAGQANLGRREWGAAGISGVYAVAERAEQLPGALSDPAGTLAARTQRVASTWSR